MPIVAMAFAATEDFFSSFDDAPEADKTVWKVGAIDGSVRGMIGDGAISWLQTEQGTEMINKGSQRNYELCRFGLKGWERFRNAAGGDIEFKTAQRIVNGKVYTVVDDTVLNMIPGPVIAELAQKIMDINNATDTLRKK